MSASNNLPWILLGVGTLGIGAVLVLRKKLPVFAGSPLANALTAGVTPELKAKVSVEIAKSTDPVFLKSLAAGLQKSGDTESALLALKKAADVTGVPQSVQGALSLPTLTIQPSTDGLPKVAMGAPTAYQVVTGDIPGAIAKRFSLSLSQLANANGANKTRIMAGSIRVNETLKLPPNAIDKGPASHANGVAS